MNNADDIDDGQDDSQDLEYPQRKSDVKIKNLILEEIKGTKELKNVVGDVQVYVLHGSVELTGMIHTAVQSDILEDIAYSMEGVIEVKNNLDIEENIAEKSGEESDY